MAKLLRFLLKANAVVWTMALLNLVFGAGFSNANGPTKITICHFGQTMEAAPRSVAAHLAHGDYLGECVVPTPVPTEHGDTTAHPLYMMWLLTSEGWDCLIRSDTHPSIERQGALCFPDLFDGRWAADNAPCAAPVMSDGSWYCDRYTPWRIK